MTRARDLANLIGSGNYTTETLTATAGQTVFTPSNSYTPNFIPIYMNGLLLDDTVDYTATNGTTITLTVAASAGDEMEVVTYNTFSVGDAITQTEADGRYYTQTEADNRFVNVTGSTITDAIQFSGSTTFNNSALPVSYNLTLDQTQSQEGSFIKVNVDPGGDIGNEGSFIEWNYVDDNVNLTPQLKIGAEVGNKGAVDAGIISEGRAAFVVKTGRPTDLLGNGTIEEAFRIHWDGYAQSMGGVVNVTPFSSTAGTNVTVTTPVIISASSVAVTKRGINDSTFIYHIVLSSETDGSAVNTNGFLYLEYNVNNSGWVATNKVITVGGMSDYDGGTSNNTYTLGFTPVNVGKDSNIEMRLIFQKSHVQSVYFNQQSLGGQPTNTSNYCSGFVMEIGAY